ncbi:MAG: FkbM family methyltransferase, partial [Actinomycetota bacterium]|nr:FkbM family methyltransferase [Actinomycetota bacterium]
YRLVHGVVAEGLSFATVVDVGANVGKFARAALGVWPDATVIAFEALPDAAHQLQTACQMEGRIEVHTVALGSRDGATTFHPHDYSLSSSALPVPPELQRHYSWARERPAITVPLRRLDGLLQNRQLQTPLLIKLDVQGFELEVLRGGLDTLRQASALVIEQSFDIVYSGQPLFEESHRFLWSAGWRMKRVLDWRREGDRVTEIDCLYTPE